MLLYLTIILISILSFKLSQSASIVSNQSTFELSIVHLNDFHTRFEEIDEYLLTCQSEHAQCVGGFTRLYSAIQKLKKKYPDSIVLNGGDSFQGTLWYKIFKWRAVQHFMNTIPFDAHTLGNHEFDDKIAGVVPFLQNLKAPAVVANMDASEEPTIQGLYKKSIVVQRNGFRIGIIGVLTSLTPEMSQSEKLKFLDESQSVNKEAERLVKEENVDTIIVLSHCGYEVEKKIAEFASPKIGLIVGGHSHTLLYTGKPPDNSVPAGPYPTVVKHADGRKILVVQASAFTKYLGHLFVKYDIDGNVVSWSGNPIYLDDKIEQDPAMKEEIAKWKKQVDEYGREVLGKTAVLLYQKICYTSECNIGNFLTDAMAFSVPNGPKKYLPIALVNPGSIRTSLPIGDITRSRLLECQPFEDTYDYAKLLGRYIKEALEISARTREEGAIGYLQVSGIRVVFNMKNPMGSRVESLKVFCSGCAVPKYEDIQMDKFYTIVSSSYIMKGGDGLKVIPENAVDYKVGKSDVEVLTQFLKLHNPVMSTLEGRITVIN